MTESKAIDAGIGCMPTELIRIIADYAIERPHTFTAVAGSVDIVCTDGGRQTEITCRQKPDDCCWISLISAASFADGQLNWTVDYDVDWTNSGMTWIAVGVTIKSSKATAPDMAFHVLADDQSWLLFLYKYSTFVQIAHNCGFRSTDDEKFFSPARNGNYRLAFDADPVGRVVRCRVLKADVKTGILVNLNNGPSITLPIEPSTFESLRPVVVIGGQQHAVFRSGPSFID